MNELDIFKDWPQDYIDEYLAAPSAELYDELCEAVALKHSGYLASNRSGVKYEETNVFDTSTGMYRKEFIAHYGTPRHSGRYPWGSGKNPQRSRHFIQRADDLAKQGLSQKEIAEAFGMSTGDYRATRKRYTEQIAKENQEKALKMKAKGHANTYIAEKLGVSEGTVRNYLDPTKKARESVTTNIANNLKEIMKDKPYLDIGEGVNRQLNISEEKLHAARLALEDEGYVVMNYDLPQVTNPSQKTSMKVLCPPGTTREDFKEHLAEVTSPDGLYFKDYGETAVHVKPIPSIDSSRVKIRYNEEGGIEKDGVIEIRPGTEDLALGNRNYAQVRIGVDGTHYLKGMAVYGDPKTMPEGVDIVFNTNKHEGTPMLGPDNDHTVLKKMKDDPQNPFGASFRQWDYEDGKGESHTSPINIVNDDEDWEGWKKNLSSQFLSKQLPVLAKKQLDIRYGEYEDEFKELQSLTNPTVKRELLNEFADNCDSAAVHLKAAALPRQGAFAILPVPSLKDNEVYAPMYNQGEEVILVRHPHAGIFEIPRLIVNNNNQEGIDVIGNVAKHAIGINSTVAQQLSGADYDGDTVLVIPTKGQKLKTDKPLDGLKDFNHLEQYARDPDDPYCTGKSRDGKIGDKFNHGMEMGKISNTITDMTIKGATLDEIERAVKHSMVIVDAEKHNLDWKRSYQENEIRDLVEKYQLRIDDDGSVHTGASTLISRAKHEHDIPERKQIYSKSVMTDEEYALYKEGKANKTIQSKLTPEEKERYDKGEVIYRDTGATKKERKRIDDPTKMTTEELAKYEKGEPVYRDTGRIIKKTQKIEDMAGVKDARELSSGYYIEDIYAEHANRLKALANEARKEMRITGKLEFNRSAEKAYDDVVGKDGTLTKKIELAELESPKERQAQIIANNVMRAKVEENPSLKDRDNRDKYKKLASKAYENARDIVRGGQHSKRYRIELSDREWEAIQAGAISDTRFKDKVWRYADKTEIKKRAMPRVSAALKPSTRSRARILINQGYALSTVAKELGVSAPALAKELGIIMDEGGD